MVLTILASFDGDTHGSLPHGSLIDDGAGNLLGMTSSGGANSKGAIFKITTAGVLTKLADFDGNGNGASPLGSLVRANDNNFYGLTSAGGVNTTLGVIFKLKPDGQPRKLFDFSGTATGVQPFGSLVQGYDGVLYGLTSAGGNGDFGAIFKIEASLTPIDEPPTVTAPASFTVTEDTTGNLQFGNNPFADPDDTDLTVTLSVEDGTINATTGGGVTVDGTATARTFAGTTASLNTYFTTAGKITYTPALDNTTARTLTTTVKGNILSASATSSITITPVGDTPVLGGATSTLEDTLSDAITIGRHAADGAEVTHFKFSGITGGRLFKSDGTTEIMNDAFIAAAEATAGVKFLPATNSVAPGSFAVEPSVDGSTVPSPAAKATANITITPVNDTPTVTAPLTFTVTEDVPGSLLYTDTPFADVDSPTLTVTLSIADGTISGAADAGITIGGTAIARTFSGTVSALNTCFTTAGKITYTTALNNNAQRTLTTQVSDGSLSASASSTVTITPVNDAPSFTLPTDQVTTLAGFASNISPGTAGESAQTVSFTVSVPSEQQSLFAPGGLPKIDNNTAATAAAHAGTLTFTPASGALGTVIVTVTAQDNGGTAGGGVDTSAPQTFAITLAPNVAPTVAFNPPSVAVAQNAGAQTVANFATFSAGPAHESGQTLVGYTVTVPPGEQSLFSAQPAIANNGTLTFTPANGQNGSATVTVVAQDNGGTIGGGVNQGTRTFTLRVVASQFVVTDASQLTTALAAAAASGTIILLNGNFDLSSVTITRSVTLVAGPGVTPSGTLQVGSGGNVNLGGGNLPGVSITVQNGGTLSGVGSFSGTLALNSGGKVLPGASPGTITADDGVWAGGAIYEWEINDAGGAPGTADLLVFNSALTVTATPADRFIVRVNTLTALNQPGLLAGFNPQVDYAWTIARAASVTGFDANAFTLDTSGFANATAGGVFGIRQTGGDIQVTFTTTFRPGLTILRAGASVTVSWPSANTLGYVLEETTTLENLSSWTPVIGIEADNGTTRSVTVDTTGELRRFYRLRKP